MAGIGEIYHVGKSGGFLGSDGLIGTDFKIEVWHGDRMALVVKYNTNTYKPISMRMEKFIPDGPQDPNMLRTAMILFASNLFETCPSFNKVKEECEGKDYIDFCREETIPEHFFDLLEESRSIDISDKVDIYVSESYPVKI